MRVALHSIVREGHEAGYEEAHATIPADLVESFARVGIHDWTIWRSGRDLFHLVDCDDFAAAMDALDTDEANARWQAFIGPYVDHFETTGDGPEGMIVGQVWSLSRQQDARGSSAV
jgi:L-rhamnose mutarotase